MAEIVTTQKKSEQFKNLIERYKPQIAVALPRHMDADRFARMAINAAVSAPEILDCTPLSQIGALMAAATLGLEPGVAGECWILPFKDNKSGTTVATFIPGYRGLVQLCWRSNQVANIGANAVYENDHFEYQEFPPKLVHRRASGDRGKLIAAYAYAKLKGGSDYQWEFLNAEDIAKIKKASRGAASKFSPWNIADWEHWMWRKSAIRQLCKMLPMSVEMRVAIDHDERADAGIPQNFDFNLDPAKEVKQPEPVGGNGDGKPQVDQETGEIENAPKATKPAAGVMI